MTLRQPLRSVRAARLPRPGHHLNFEHNVVRFAAPWLVLIAGVFLSGLFLHQIPPCRYEKRGRLLGYHISSRHIACVGDEVLYGLGLFAFWFLIFGLTLGHRVYSVVKTDYGLDWGQFPAICAFTVLCSFVVSFLVYLIYLCVTYAGRHSDSLPARQAEKYAEIERARKKHQKAYDDTNAPTTTGG